MGDLTTAPPAIETSGKLDENDRRTENNRLSKLVRAAKLGWTFIVGHGALQVLSICTSLFLVRRLSVAAYAQYSLALGFQTTAISLTNLGFTESIIPLVGARGNDAELVGSYVRAAKHLRNALFLAVAPGCSILFAITASKHGWSLSSQLILLLSILLSIHFSSSLSCYSAPLILKRRLSDYYAAQVLPAAGRLTAFTVGALLGFMGSGFASMTGALSLLAGSALARRKSKPLIVLTKSADKTAVKEMLRCMLPMMPTAIFVSFQPQLALFLISAFGQTSQIAEVAALNKIGQIFLVFNTFNTLVLEPYVAKVSTDRLAGTYARVISGALLLATILSAAAFLFPSPLTALLGSKYRDLTEVVFWVVLGSSVSIVNNAIWVMNRSRKWIFWRGSALEIGFITLSQIAFVMTVGVHTTRSAAIFSLVASISSLLAQTYVMFFGFAYHRQSQE